MGHNYIAVPPNTVGRVAGGSKIFNEPEGDLLVTTNIATSQVLVCDTVNTKWTGFINNAGYLVFTDSANVTNRQTTISPTYAVDPVFIQLLVDQIMPLIIKKVANVP